MKRLKTDEVTNESTPLRTTCIDRCDADAQFKDMINHMVSTPNWTLKIWRSLMEKQLGGWTSYIPGLKSTNEMKTIKTFTGFSSKFRIKQIIVNLTGILDKMSDSELEHPDQIKGPDRERLAAATGTTVDEVVQMIKYYQQTKIMATWLRLRLNR